MAEVVKAKKREKVVEIEAKKSEVKNKNVKKTTKKVDSKKESSKKKSLKERIILFCNGVKNEAKKVRWTSKQDMIKYSIATIIFIIFCSLFFYAIDTIFALVQSLVK